MYFAAVSGEAKLMEYLGNGTAFFQQGKLKLIFPHTNSSIFRQEEVPKIIDIDLMWPKIPHRL